MPLNKGSKAKERRREERGKARKAYIYKGVLCESLPKIGSGRLRGLVR